MDEMFIKADYICCVINNEPAEKLSSKNGASTKIIDNYTLNLNMRLFALKKRKRISL